MPRGLNTCHAVYMLIQSSNLVLCHDLILVSARLPGSTNQTSVVVMYVQRAATLVDNLKQLLRPKPFSLDHIHANALLGVTTHWLNALNR